MQSLFEKLQMIARLNTHPQHTESMSVNQRVSTCLLDATTSILICVLGWVEQASRLDIWCLLVLSMVTY
jgi:hypothetical protein